jgi:hypothetical protein
MVNLFIELRMKKSIEEDFNTESCKIKRENEVIISYKENKRKIISN